jgi:hypothetical protein
LPKATIYIYFITFVLLFQGNFKIFGGIMPHININLPSYPQTRDVWDVLKDETRPIMVYGMGNGADKLFMRFEAFSIKVSEVFASDGFVRGHSYRGYKVKSFSEIKENYSDFVIVISFASNKPDVIEMLSLINNEYDVFIPDMPIANTEEYFDKDFYNSHYEEIISAYDMLCDRESKRIFASVINYKLSGKMDYLLAAFNSKDEIYDLLRNIPVEVFVDVGAYNGDTAKEALQYFNNLKKIYAIEPSVLLKTLEFWAVKK